MGLLHSWLDPLLRITIGCWCLWEPSFFCCIPLRPIVQKTSTWFASFHTVRLFLLLLLWLLMLRILRLVYCLIIIGIEYRLWCLFWMNFVLEGSLIVIAISCHFLNKTHIWRSTSTWRINFRGLMRLNTERLCKGFSRIEIFTLNSTYKSPDFTGLK